MIPTVFACGVFTVYATEQKVQYCTAHDEPPLRANMEERARLPQPSWSHLLRVVRLAVLHVVDMFKYSIYVGNL